MRVRSVQGDTLERLCQRCYGRTAGVTEQVLAANPALAAFGVILPAGTPVELPEQPAGPATTATVSLWD
jgi:phage tail protein X